MEPNTPNPKKSSSTVTVPVKTQLLGIGITNDTEINILEYIVNTLNKSQENFIIVTPNPEIIVFSQKNFHFKKILNEAKIALCDGIGLWWASKVLGKPIKHRITGVDLMEKLCERIADHPITVGFLGGRHGVAELTAECLVGKYSGLKVVFVGEEWSENTNVIARNNVTKQSRKDKEDVASENTEIASPLTTSGERVRNDVSKEIDVLFVAYGFPKQEEWMYEHINKSPVRIMMGVGGAFDYISGRVPRAPKFLRTLGLEWLYRLIRQPWRWKRQLALIEFIFLVIKEKFLIFPSPFSRGLG